MSDEVPISHLQTRKIEGRVLIPFIAAYREKLGDAVTRELVEAKIRRLAAQDEERWAEMFGTDLAALRTVAEKVWAGGGSLDVNVLEQTRDHLDFNVPRCRYAEFYRNSALPRLAIFSIAIGTVQ